MYQAVHYRLVQPVRSARVFKGESHNTSPVGGTTDDLSVGAIAKQRI